MKHVVNTPIWCIRLIMWFSNRTGTSFDDGMARVTDWTRLPVPNLPLSHRSNQFFLFARVVFIAAAFCFVFFWLNMPNRPFYSILQLFAQHTGLLLEARLEVKLLSYKTSCNSSANRVILMLIRPWKSQFTCEKQEGLYQNRQPPALLPFKGQGIELTTVSPPTNVRALVNHNSSKQSEPIATRS